MISVICQMMKTRGKRLSPFFRNIMLLLWRWRGWGNTMMYQIIAVQATLSSTACGFCFCCAQQKVPYRPPNVFLILALRDDAAGVFLKTFANLRGERAVEFARLVGEVDVAMLGLPRLTPALADLAQQKDPDPATLIKCSGGHHPRGLIQAIENHDLDYLETYKHESSLEEKGANMAASIKWLEIIFKSLRNHSEEPLTGDLTAARSWIVELPQHVRLHISFML